MPVGAFIRSFQRIPLCIQQLTRFRCIGVFDIVLSYQRVSCGSFHGNLVSLALAVCEGVVVEGAGNEVT